MAAKEAKARIKINKLLEESGWRFFDNAASKANIVLEPKVKLTKAAIDALGDNFEDAGNGFIDFLLLDETGFPLVVLEAKSEDKNPLVGKEQARKYAKSQNCRFVILSNGNLHYFWDLEQGNPHIVTRFPAPDSIRSYHRFQPNPQRLITEPVGKDYIALTQLPNYASEAGWTNPAEREDFIRKNGLRFLRDYQRRAVQAIQNAVAEGHSRFLFEMATGTGKTLTAAAVIKLFLRTGNARRVLFLVDRLELEDQANKAFIAQLKNDYTSVIYKERRDEWRKAEIVVTTVQSLLFNGKYRRLFSPTDFDLVISDEAHRSIGGNARAVFEYFVGYKLGLTATPRDYLKKFDANKPTTRDPRETERRLLLDTYRTFGCESGQPTFRYSLLDGVRDGHLINPVVVDARTDITTQLLSDKGYAVVKRCRKWRNRRRKLFPEGLREEILLRGHQSALLPDLPQPRAARPDQPRAWQVHRLRGQSAPRGQADAEPQRTGRCHLARQVPIGFCDAGHLAGSGCTAIHPQLHQQQPARLGQLSRELQDQQGTCLRHGRHDDHRLRLPGHPQPRADAAGVFALRLRADQGSRHTQARLSRSAFRQAAQGRAAVCGKQQKTQFKFFDFFANCEYFEDKFDYDEVLRLPRPGAGGEGPEPPSPPPPSSQYEHTGDDALKLLAEQAIGPQGMKIDRMFFEAFENTVKADADLQQFVDNEQWDQAVDYVTTRVLDKPAEFYTLDKLRRAAGVDRRLTLREILEKVFGLIPGFKSRDELLEDEFQKFLLDQPPDALSKHADAIVALKYFFKAYATDGRLRDIIENRRLTDLNVNPAFSMADFKAVPKEWRERIPEYVKDYVSLNQFM